LIPLFKNEIFYQQFFFAFFAFSRIFCKIYRKNSEKSVPVSGILTTVLSLDILFFSKKNEHIKITSKKSIFKYFFIIIHFEKNALKKI
jgi:hypothetical protein